MPAFIPLAGRPGVRDAQNPTLIPNVGTPVASGQGTLDTFAPGQMLSTFARTDATAAATLGGTVTTGDVITLKVTFSTISGGSASFAYTTVGGDTLTTILEGLVNLINGSQVASNAGIIAQLGGSGSANNIVLHIGGPAGNLAVLSATVTGAATETVTLVPSNGVFSGGAGPIIPTANFVFPWKGTTNLFWYGTPRVISLDMLTAMVAGGAPIV